MNWHKELIRSDIAISRRVERVLPQDSRRRQEKIERWLDQIHESLKRHLATYKKAGDRGVFTCVLDDGKVALMRFFNAEDLAPIGYYVAISFKYEKLESFTREDWVVVEMPTQ